MGRLILTFSHRQPVLKRTSNRFPPYLFSRDSTDRHPSTWPHTRSRFFWGVSCYFYLLSFLSCSLDSMVSGHVVAWNTIAAGTAAALSLWTTGQSM
ncbi:hypothetical protein VTK73DRAFT_4713 [Phialemonium thermophilum]|uniref:Uncharacterized protein n=1 Tax=Phialemonium thermophilum TaxID=223376 RepID=A0ABR3WSZ5_9PEZI